MYFSVTKPTTNKAPASSSFNRICAGKYWLMPATSSDSFHEVAEITKGKVSAEKDG